MKKYLIRQHWDYYTVIVSLPQTTMFSSKELMYPYRQSRMRKVLSIFGLDRRHLTYERGRDEFTFFKKDKSIRVHINKYFIQIQFNGTFWVKERSSEKFLNYLERLKKDYGRELLRISRIDIASDIELPIEKLLVLKEGYVMKGRSQSMVFAQFSDPKTFKVQSIGFKNSRMSFLIYNKLDELNKSKAKDKKEYYQNMFEGKEHVSRLEIRLLKDRSKTFQNEILNSDSVEEFDKIKDKIHDYFYRQYSVKVGSKQTQHWTRQKKIVLKKIK